MLRETFRYIINHIVIHVHEWYEDINSICKKIKTKCTLNDEYLASMSSVKELIEMRDASN